MGRVQGADSCWSHSGVLAASLERSRQRWISEGIFEKYWTKPSKKKNQADIKNPPKDTMVKLGSCTITIEPHAFEATLYTVREPQVTFLPPIGVTPPRLLPHYGPPASQPPASYSYPNPSHQAQTHTQPPPFANQSASSFPQDNALQQRPLTNPRSAPNSANITPVSIQSPLGAMTGMPPQAQQQASKPSQDPVIQMLATKAATDHSLKALMRVVASGKASQAELKVFQGHIDELNGILQSRSHANRPIAPSPSTASPLHPGTPSAELHSAPLSQHIPRDSNVNGSVYSSLPTPIKTESLPNHYSEPLPPVRSKGPPAAKPDISAVVFEITAGSGDRYLFPKFSVLEYLPGGTRVIASFIVVRKGSVSDSGAYDPKSEYYQPVTINLSTPHARLLEPLARVVAPLDEVRRHMDKIMDTMTRAREVHLALRLPRAPDDVMEDEEEDVDRSRGDVIQAVYGPPSALVPLQRQSTTKTPLVKVK